MEGFVVGEKKIKLNGNTPWIYRKKSQYFLLFLIHKCLIQTQPKAKLWSPTRVSLDLIPKRSGKKKFTWKIFTKKMRENVIVCFVLLHKLDASLSRENINGKSKTSRNRKASFSFYQSRKLTRWKYSEIDESSADLIWKMIRCFTEIGKKQQLH